MDLGIKGRNAIVCASSRGLGKGCAFALAEAGVNLTLNGRDEKILARTAIEISNRFDVEVSEVPGDVSDPAVQKALIAASPVDRHSGQQQWRPAAPPLQGSGPQGDHRWSHVEHDYAG
jgi:hypothetical protein